MSESDDRDLSEFVHRWAEAIVSNDVERLQDFTTEDWVLVDKPGPIPREVFHGVVASGQLRHDTMSHEVLEVRRLTDDVALLVTHATSSGAFDGNPIEADEWTSDVLVRTADGWRCTLTQLTARES